MGCACKTNQQIAYIQKMYGDRKLNSSEPKTHIGQDIKFFFHKVILMLILLPFIPIMAIYVLGRKLLKKGPIRIDKLFKLSNKS